MLSLLFFVHFFSLANEDTLHSQSFHCFAEISKNDFISKILSDWDKRRFFLFDEKTKTYIKPHDNSLHLGYHFRSHIYTPTEAYSCKFKGERRDYSKRAHFVAPHFYATIGYDKDNKRHRIVPRDSTSRPNFLESGHYHCTPGMSSRHIVDDIRLLLAKTIKELDHSIPFLSSKPELKRGSKEEAQLSRLVSVCQRLPRQVVLRAKDGRSLDRNLMTIHRVLQRFIYHYPGLEPSKNEERVQTVEEVSP